MKRLREAAEEYAEALKTVEAGNIRKIEFSDEREVDQLVLAAIHLLRGEGYSLSIADMVNELAPKQVRLGAIVRALDRLSLGGLIASWSDGPARDNDVRSTRFKLTEAGERALAKARKGSKQLRVALEEFE